MISQFFFYLKMRIAASEMNQALFDMSEEERAGVLIYATMIRLKNESVDLTRMIAQAMINPKSLPLAECRMFALSSEELRSHGISNYKKFEKMTLDYGLSHSKMDMSLVYLALGYRVWSITLATAFGPAYVTGAQEMWQYLESGQPLIPKVLEEMKSMAKFTKKDPFISTEELIRSGSSFLGLRGDLNKIIAETRARPVL